MFKALGDDTRFSIYTEVARSTRPKSTGEIADTLALHPNTVRPHLERMREVGLLDVEIDNRGSVGRPQHLYRLATGAPSLGLEPSAFRLLATLLAGVAAAGQPASDEIAAVGRQQGRVSADERTPGVACLRALVQELAELGFDPATSDEGTTTTIAFHRCPFGELAEAFPDLVCHLHRGMVEGFVERADPGGEVEVIAFHTLADRDPCRVDLDIH